MVLETHMKLCMTAGLFDPLPPQKTKKQNNNKSNKKIIIIKAQKLDFVNLLKNLVFSFFSIWSKMKVYIICYSSA